MTDVLGPLLTAAALVLAGALLDPAPGRVLRARLTPSRHSREEPPMIEISPAAALLVPLVLVVAAWAAGMWIGLTVRRDETADAWAVARARGAALRDTEDLLTEATRARDSLSREVTWHRTRDLTHLARRQMDDDAVARATARLEDEIAEILRRPDGAH